MDRWQRLSIYLSVLISLLLYIFIGYFLERDNSIYLIGSYSIVFAAYLWLVQKSQPCSTYHFLFVAIAFRLVLLLAFPSLSDDIYRFFWDGKLLENGINPFGMLPSELVNSNSIPEGLSASVYENLNSPDYFTIYPPFAQFIFWISASLSSSTMQAAIIIRLLILFAELGSFYYLLKLSKYFNLASHKILLYALNPLVILELTGNLHFEAFMIFFLLAGVYYLLQNKWLISSIMWSLAIGSKLIPLIFLPLFIRRFDHKKVLRWYGFIAIICLFLFLPLLSEELINGMTESINLYFQKFEFNASIYFVVREIGYWIKGYNIIQSAGPWLAAITITSILVFSFLSKKLKLSDAMTWVLLIYFVFATTVHPWYITTLLALSVFGNYRFAVVWSFLIFLTYIGYHSGGFNENYWVVGIEYSIVFVYIFYEIFKPKSQKEAVSCAV